MMVVVILLGVVYKTTYKCQDSPEEMEKVETEKSFQVSCFISQGEPVMRLGGDAVPWD